jgi:hypothetical protein
MLSRFSRLSKTIQAIRIACAVCFRATIELVRMLRGCGAKPTCIVLSQPMSWASNVLYAAVEYQIRPLGYSRESGKRIRPRVGFLPRPTQTLEMSAACPMAVRRPSLSCCALVTGVFASMTLLWLWREIGNEEDHNYQ